MKCSEIEGYFAMQVKSQPFIRRIRPGWRRHGRMLISSVAVITALVLLPACGGAAQTAPSRPRVQAAATQAIGGGASAVGTAQAAASPAAATIQAGAPP